MNAGSENAHGERMALALVGFGRMGRVYAELIERGRETMQLAVIVEPDAASRDAAAKRYGTERVVSELDRALDRDVVRAIVVASPTSTHHEIVLAALGSGRAVLCEKPPALTLAHAQEIVKEAERPGACVQLGFMRRFDAAYLDAWRRVRRGDIGDPLLVKCVGRDPKCPDPAFADPAVSGGLLVDMGIHDFDLARWFVQSEVVRVSTEGSLRVCSELASVGDIDNALVNLRFADDSIGNVDVGRTAFYGYDIRMEVLGTEGSIQIGTARHRPVTVLDRKGGHFETVPYLHDRFTDAYRAQLEAFVEAAAGGGSPPVTARDGLAALQIALAATESYRERRWIDIEPAT